MSWLMFNEIPYATWKLTSKVLRVDRSFRGKRITFALKAAKTSLIRTRTSMLPAVNKAQDNRLELMLLLVIM